MERIISDSYIKSDKYIFKKPNSEAFDRKVIAVNEMFGWLYDRGILKDISFQWKDYSSAAYFALDAKDLLPYREAMLQSGVKDASLSVHHIFDEPYTPCRFSGAIELGWTMFTYRSNNGCVSSSWECGLVQGLNNEAAHEIHNVLQSRGPKAAIGTAFSCYEWKPSDLSIQPPLESTIQSAKGKAGSQPGVSKDSDFGR